MTTTNDSAIRKITALRDRARHAMTPAAEAETALTMARKLCVKHSIDQAILDAPTQQMKKPIIDGSAPQEKKYSCRFGCGFFTQHTIDELNECAAKARNANGGNAYTAPKTDPFADLFGKHESRNAGPFHAEPKARTNGSHKYCDHEATKSARARCRKDRGY